MKNDEKCAEYFGKLTDAIAEKDFRKLKAYADVLIELTKIGLENPEELQKEIDALEEDHMKKIKEIHKKEYSTTSALKANQHRKKDYAMAYLQLYRKIWKELSKILQRKEML